jgi:hypothetical protein
MTTNTSALSHIGDVNAGNSSSGALSSYRLKASGSLGSAGSILTSNSTGGISWENIKTDYEIYVSPNGNDTIGNGSINQPFKTIERAIEAARVLVEPDENTKGQVSAIYLHAGDYYENNPLTLPEGIAIIGNSLRGTNIIAKNHNLDVFYLNNASYIRDVTVKGYWHELSNIPGAPTTNDSTGQNTGRNLLDGASARSLAYWELLGGVDPANPLDPPPYAQAPAAFAFPPDGIYGWDPTINQWRLGVPVTRSPYVLNCTSLTTTGIGLKIDGELAEGDDPTNPGTRSCIGGLYTIINQGGIGVLLINQGYSQLVNIYTICTEYSIIAESGGFCSLNCSDTTFGKYGLFANGHSPQTNRGFVLSQEAGNSNTFTIQLYKTNPDGSDNLVGGTYRTPFINNTIKFGPDDENDPNYDPNYYTITSTTVPTQSGPNAGRITLNTIESIPRRKLPNTPVILYQRSQMTASGHTFEYSGTGIDIRYAVPFIGGTYNGTTFGIPRTDLLVVDDTTRQNLPTTDQHYATVSSGGVVNYTSTDQYGNFSIGSGMTIVGPTSSIQGITFQKSLFGLMTPFILALESS